MGTFTASLRASGDVRGLAATIELSDGELRIAAGGTQIGSWPLSDVELEETPGGYRLAADGDQILIEMNDAEAFSAELVRRQKKGLLRRQRRESAPPPPANNAETRQKAPPSAKRRRRAASNETPATGHQDPGTAGEHKASSPGPLDALLLRAEKRLGAYLPGWVFTRATLLLTVLILIPMAVFPGVMSRLMLIVGAAVVVVGAVAYTDSMLASKWLPGRTQPPHVLLLGTTILLLGVLLGVAAS